MRAIAIDGPAASGKSSAAKIVAERLKFKRLDSGTLYRSLTHILSCHNLAEKPDSPEARQIVDKLRPVVSWSKSDSEKDRSETDDVIMFHFETGMIEYNGSDITDILHSPEIDSKVGCVAKELYVREKVHDIQRKIISGSPTGIVVDGRDIGTVVLPSAFLKIFIKASAEKRAERRVKQSGGDYETVLAEIRKRDHHDETRKHGPLKAAPDAVILDNSDMSLDETVQKIVDIYNEKCHREG